MKFSKWLYSLTSTDQFILVGFFIFSIGMSYLTILAVRSWHFAVNKNKKYAHNLLITPLPLLVLALLYSSLLYMSIGKDITLWIVKILE